MNILISYNWLKDYLETDAEPYDIAKYVSLSGPSIEKVTKKGDDFIFEIEITSNRIDTVSVIGFARETAVILPRHGFKTTFKEPLFPKPKANNKTSLTVIDSSNLCNRLLAVVMDVKVGQSPLYIKQRLENAGVRSLNNLIDITNYVMLEVGHPTHIFDYDRVKTANLVLRNAKKGERLVTLDNKEYKLREEDVVIDDGTGRIVDLPGIMGTQNSVVTSDTKKIIFFIESNNPSVIRNTSMNLGIRTLAATINEKHPDPATAKLAFNRGIELFEKLAEGKITSHIIDIYPKEEKSQQILTDLDFINKRIGVKIRENEVIEILESLSFSIKKEGKKMTIIPPHFRQYDVIIPEDIVEEVARIYGYYNLPNNLPPPVYYKQPKELERLFLGISKVKTHLKHLGLNEVTNYSMISKIQIQNINDSPNNYLHLYNSISEEIEYLRKSLTPSLIKNIADNKGKRDILRLFELAKVYLPENSKLPNEVYKLAIAANTDFFDLKGIIEALLNELRIADYEFKIFKGKMFSPNVQSQIIINGKPAGFMGLIKKEISQKNNLKNDVYTAEIDFTHLIENAKEISTYKHISAYAVIKLDLTIDTAGTQSYASIINNAYKTSRLLTDVQLINQYKNKITLRFFFTASDRNITEEEAIKELSQINRGG